MGTKDPSTMKIKFLTGLVLMTCFAAAICAQTPTPASTPVAEAESKKPEEKKPEKPDTWLYIRNVDVYPVSGPMLRNTGLLVKNSRIELIGDEIDVPKEALTIDGTGLRAYPGLIHLNGSGLLSQSRGAPKDGVDPFGMKTIMGLAHGITTVINNTSAVKLVYDTVDDAGLRDSLFLGLFYSSTNPRGKAQLRADLRKARDYIRELSEFEAKKRAGDAAAKAPDEKAVGNAMQYVALLNGKTTAVFNVETRHQILEVCELVNEFRFRTVLRGVAEGWTCAADIGRAGMRVVVIPRSRTDAAKDVNRPNGTSIENAAILHARGVPVAVTTANSAIELDGMAGGDVLSLPSEAGFAIRGGLPADAGLAAVTIEAARVFGLDDRIGSLEPGKDADIVITDGDILHYATMVQYAIVNGRIAYDKSKESLYRLIRPRDPALTPGKQWWPRPFGPMPEEWTFHPKLKSAPNESAPASTSQSAPSSAPASAPAPAAESRPAEK